MATYPLTLPTRRLPRSVQFVAAANNLSTRSPYTGARKVFPQEGDRWRWNVLYGPIAANNPESVDIAEELIAFKLDLNGSEGTFLMGDPSRVVPRGTWLGSPIVNGAAQQGRALSVNGFAVGATGKFGDYFQLGTGVNSRLYKLIKPFTADGAGIALLEFWPTLRSAPSNGQQVIKDQAKGVFNMVSDEADWDVDSVMYGFSFECEETIEF